MNGPSMVSTLVVRRSSLVMKRWFISSRPNLSVVLQNVPALFLNNDMRSRTFELGRLVRGPGTKEVKRLRTTVILPIAMWNATTPLVTARVLVQCRLTLRRLGLVLRRSNLIETFTRLSTATVAWWKLAFVAVAARLKQLSALIGIGLVFGIIGRPNRQNLTLGRMQNANLVLVVPPTVCPSMRCGLEKDGELLGRVTL